MVETWVSIKINSNNISQLYILIWFYVSITHNTAHTTTNNIVKQEIIVCKFLPVYFKPHCQA